MRTAICCFGSRNTPKVKLVGGYILKILATKSSCEAQLKPGHGNETLGMRLSWRHRDHSFRPAFPQHHLTTYRVAKHTIYTDSFLSCTCRTPPIRCSRTAYYFCGRKFREIQNPPFRGCARWVEFPSAYTLYKYGKDHRPHLGAMFTLRPGTRIVVEKKKT